nr:unnamed protein product [Spirometra erinaceieuropaei]
MLRTNHSTHYSLANQECGHTPECICNPESRRRRRGTMFPPCQHDDARMCLDVAFTASRYGACIANYVELVELLKGPAEDTQTGTRSQGSGPFGTLPKLVVNGARLRDCLTGKEFVVRAKCVVNATGPFTDSVRKLEDSSQKPICQPSIGTHIVLPKYYSSLRSNLSAPTASKRGPFAANNADAMPTYIHCVPFACREYARHAVDFIARRSRLSFLNVRVAEEVLPKVVELMAKELNWCPMRKAKELEEAKKFLETEMGLGMKGNENIPINFSPQEKEEYLSQFNIIDTDRKGFITLKDLHNFFTQQGETLSDDTLHRILTDIDLNRNGKIDPNEFLQFMSSIKTGAVPHHSLKKVLDRAKIPVYRSGGGV